MGRVEGRIAIVTGAAQGLGAADARMLAREGARVVATDVNEDAGRALADEIGGVFVRQDVSDEASWTDWIDRVERDFGGIPPFLAYSAAKGGIRSMTKAIAAHCLGARNGIRCNSVHPGSIDTPMVQSALAETQGIRLEEAEDPEAARRALGIGEPDDVAHLVLYLASDESKHVNGAELVIDNAATAI